MVGASTVVQVTPAVNVIDNVNLNVSSCVYWIVKLTRHGGRKMATSQAQYPQIPDGVNYLGCDGLVVPSARYDCNNLVIYMQNMERDCFLKEVKPRQFRWSDWSVNPQLSESTDLGTPRSCHVTTPGCA